MIYFMWHGGPNYAVGYVEDDTETAESVEAVVEVLRDRAANRDGTTPNVEDSTAHVWTSDPRGQSDPYPDYLIEQDEDGEFHTLPL